MAVFVILTLNDRAADVPLVVLRIILDGYSHSYQHWFPVFALETVSDKPSRRMIGLLPHNKEVQIKKAKIRRSPPNLRDSFLRLKGGELSNGDSRATQYGGIRSKSNTNANISSNADGHDDRDGGDASGACNSA